MYIQVNPIVFSYKNKYEQLVIVLFIVI